jgi:DNA repair protein RecN (Recombination protein N)
MLQALSITHVVLIEHLDLVFEPGLTVLTGETGTGKSILLDALQLALGQRADTSLIRQGQREASVTATFHGAPTLCPLLERLGLPWNEGTLLLRRSMSKEGTSRAYINDRPVTLQTLRLVAEELLDIHGQFDRLLDPHHHRQFLDAYGGHDPLLTHVKEAYKKWQQAQASWDQATVQSQEKAQRVTFLTMALEELRTLAYRPQEEEELMHLRARALHGEKIQDYSQQMYEKLYGPKGVDTLLGETLGLCEKVQELSGGALSLLHKALDEAYISLHDDDFQLKAFASASLEHSLETIDNRLFNLKQGARKFGVDIPNLGLLYTSFQEELDTLNVHEDTLKNLEQYLKDAKTSYLHKAQELSNARRQTGMGLEKAVMEELQNLKLEKASISFFFEALEEKDWHKEGHERITLLVRTNPGSEPGPMAKIASGGERSRLILALKTVMMAKFTDFTQVFDEIDSGMGGAAAAAVGHALKTLSSNQQVLAISHAPQVAGFADHHWHVYKEDAQGHTKTYVKALSFQERLEEIARMLSGDAITPEARRAAEALIKHSL